MNASTATAENIAIDPRAPRRVRHETRRRQLTVQRVDKIAAHMIRVTLGGDLAGFASLGFDDHIKLFFPVEATGAEPQVLSRDYTPRRFDPAADTLEIEFVLHDAGPATRWAQNARPGQQLEIGGPRGSFVIPLTFDWHLLVGDDTALPAMARRVAELPAGACAVVLAEVDGPEDRLPIEGAADVCVTWAYRDGVEAGQSNALSRVLKTMKLPAGDYYAWVATESLTAKALRAQLIADHGANPKWMRAAGYWRRGAVAVHDVFND